VFVFDAIVQQHIEVTGWNTLVGKKCFDGRRHSFEEVVAMIAAYVFV
jgi:hypothetical protein